jgi:hypothetical protein
MPRIVLTHSVVDIEQWLKGKDERAAAFASFGSNVTDYVAMHGSNQVAITADVNDLEGAQAMLASPPPEAAVQAESHGVLPPISAYIER